MVAELNPVVLVIVDGFGIAPASKGNAITLADTPVWDNLVSLYPHTELYASGTHVGLPDGIMGNSEVGHLTIGAGRITFQSLELINRAYLSNEIENLPAISQIKDHLVKSKGKLHLMGLLSDGGVHSHQNHLCHLIDLFGNEVFSTYIHAFTDGRDTPPKSSHNYVKSLLDFMQKYPQVNLSSIIGRYYAMDRDKKWGRTKIAYDMLTKMMVGEEEKALIAIKKRYQMNETDEFFKPIVVNAKGRIENGDAVLFFNFRPDRARQISMALNGMWELDSKTIDDLFFSTMTSYDDSFDFPILFKTKKIADSLAELVSKIGLKQVHIAETEKYAHVTYFLNGGNEKIFENEKRILIPSLNVATYDLQPSMSTIEIAEKALEYMNQGYSLVVLNIAAPDMVGHTGIIKATIEAIEVTDRAFGMIYEASKKYGYVMCVTSDHGNCEKMLNGNEPHTAHTTNKVPFLITKNVSLKKNMGLQNITPSILELLNIPKPEKMTGTSLIS